MSSIILFKVTVDAIVCSIRVVFTYINHFIEAIM